jgi:hypothetical protein
MNMNRQSRREDVLFVIALLVPAIFSADRLFDSKREMDLIARGKAPVVQMAGTPADDLFTMVMAG